MTAVFFLFMLPGTLHVFVLFFQNNKVEKLLVLKLWYDFIKEDSKELLWMLKIFDLAVFMGVVSFQVHTVLA